MLRSGSHATVRRWCALWRVAGPRRWLSKASLFQVYAGRTPAQIFSAYGAPGTWRRFVFLVLELGLLWISADRLYACCSLLNVAGLSLKQRCAALVFAGRQSKDSMAAMIEDEEVGDKYLSTAPDYFKEFAKIQAKQFETLKTEMAGIKDLIDQARIEAEDARRAAEEAQEKMEDVEMEVEAIRNDLEEMYLTKSEIEKMLEDKLQEVKDTMKHSSRSSRAVEKTVEEAMQKWHNTVKLEPDTESE
ncbi:unnamed protein product [Prorocentrum cordatum]|uniref:Uncharacterized protein n=1 Tax=Prorocentrum cordatum TaxID=2364126 RepID=A0ABN9PAD9_9DINO|nr:unnamed protein product [Polarella glacialis]